MTIINMFLTIVCSLYFQIIQGVGVGVEEGAGDASLLSMRSGAQAWIATVTRDAHARSECLCIIYCVKDRCLSRIDRRR